MTVDDDDDHEKTRGSTDLFAVYCALSGLAAVRDGSRRLFLRFLNVEKEVERRVVGAVNVEDQQDQRERDGRAGDDDVSTEGKKEPPEE